MEEKDKDSATTSAPSTFAVHAHTEDGAHHLVGIGDLRVMLFNDGGSWFAQGLEIDYFAQGCDLEDVKRRFERGLYATLGEHLKVYGNINRLLEVAPDEVWREFFETSPETQTYSHFSFHRPGYVPQFAGIRYFAEAS